MLWTAFTWGLGLSCGAAVGLLVLLAGLVLVGWVLPDKHGTRKVNEQSLVALSRRNEIGMEQVEVLERIATAVERIDCRQNAADNMIRKDH